MVEDNTDNTPIWWEKTVECCFCKEHAPSSIAPLDGMQESSFADTIIEEGGKFALIEFKRDKGCLSSEKDKFTDYLDAKEKLESDSENCHYLIYGTDSKTDFLKAQGYFSGVTIKTKDILKKGVDYNFFEAYLKKLATYKERGGSGNGLSSVACVCSIEGKTVLLSISEVLKLDPTLSLRANNKIMQENSTENTVLDTNPAPG